MCRNQGEIIREITQEVSTMIENINLAMLNSNDLDELLNIRIFEHVTQRVNEEFPDNDSSDSGENARIERSILRNIARLINDQNAFANIPVTFDDISFRFISN